METALSPDHPPRATDDQEKAFSPKVIATGDPGFEAFPPPPSARQASPHNGPTGHTPATAGRPTQKGWPRVSTGGPEPGETTVVLQPEPAATGSMAVASDGAAEAEAAGPASGESGPEAPACADVGPEPRSAADTHSLSDLPVWLRISLIALGLVLIAVGVAGLVLPGLQGILTILLGLALLSLVSHQMYRFLCWCLAPWPKLRDRVMGYRHRTFRWLNAKVGSVEASAVGPEEAAAGEMDRPGSGER